MDRNDQVLEIVKARGPLLPAVVGQELKVPIIIASAMLSDLSSQGKIKISSVKIGGSPLYFVEEQREKLLDYEKYLHEKERRAVDRLKKAIVLRDRIEEPVVRVALREAKDFAKPIEREVSGSKELFWVWYLASREEIDEKIRALLGISSPISKPAHQPQKPVAPVYKIQKPEIAAGPAAPSINEKQANLHSVEKPAILEKPPRMKKSKDPQDASFINDLSSFISSHTIKVVEQKIAKADHEVDCVLQVPSNIGDVFVFAKVINKKKISESDLQSAYVQAQKRALPLLFLYRGELSKKASKMLSGEFKFVSAVQF